MYILTIFSALINKAEKIQTFKTFPRIISYSTDFNSMNNLQSPMYLPNDRLSVHSRTQDPSPRHQIAKHLSRQTPDHQARRLRHRAYHGRDDRLRQNLRRNPILSQSRDLGPTPLKSTFKS